MNETTGNYSNITTPIVANILVDSLDEEFFKCSSGMALLRFIFGVVMNLPLCLLGILGNILAMIVLPRQRHQGSTTTLLIGLAVTDTLVLIFGLLLSTLFHIYVCGGDMGHYVTNYGYIRVALYPLLYIVRMSEIWLTTLLAVDRWMFICKPGHSQRYNTRNSALWRMAGVVLCAIIVCLPRFFEFKVHTYKSISLARTTSLYKNQVYTIVYKITIAFLTMYLVPMVILLVTTFKLLRSLHNQQNNRGSKRSVSVIVIVIVVIFLFSNVMPMVSQLMFYLEKAFPALSAYEDKRRVIVIISNFTVTFNSAVNFVIYCVCSLSFRKTLVGLFRRKSVADDKEATSGSSVIVTTFPMEPLGPKGNQ